MNHLFYPYESDYIITHYLVGGSPTPLKNEGVRQLGWWLFPAEWENKIHIPVTTNQSLIHIITPYPYIWVNYNNGKVNGKSWKIPVGSSHHQAAIPTAYSINPCGSSRTFWKYDWRFFFVVPSGYD